MYKLKFLLIILFLSLPFITSAYYYDNYQQYDKVIRINTYAEKLSYYEKWIKIWEFKISSWDAQNPTPAWRFRIMNKNPMMWSKTAWKWMPNWMEFYIGTYGIHWLPLDTRFIQHKTEEEAIWIADAGWCVRVWANDINKLYSWADYNTVVLVAYDMNQYTINSNWEKIINNYYKAINNKNYEKALNLKIYKNISLDRFTNIYNWLYIENIRIKKITNSMYIATVDIKRNWIFIARWIKWVFMINWDKILKSYVIR